MFGRRSNDVKDFQRMRVVVWEKPFDIAVAEFRKEKVIYIDRETIKDIPPKQCYFTLNFALAVC